MNEREERISLIILVVFAAIIRLWFITQKNMWFDEIFSWQITRGSFRDIVIGTAGDIHPPLYYFVLKIWEYGFGTSVYGLRSLSAILSALTIFFIYPISKRVLDISGSLLVIFLYAISPLNIYFAQEARMSALNLFLNAGSVYFLILLTGKVYDRKWFYSSPSFYFYTLFTLLALYTHYFSFFILFAQGIYLIYLFRKELRKLTLFIPSILLIAIGYYPWFNTMIKQVSKGQSWRGGQTVWAVIFQFLSFIKDIGMGFYHRYANDFATYGINVVLIALLSLSVYGLIKLYRKREGTIKNELLIIFLASVPFACAMIISLKQWIEYFRYLSIIIPYILICIVMGMQYFKKKLQYSVLVILILINLYGVYLYFTIPSKNNDYRVLFSTLAKDEEITEIFVYPHYFGWILDYYSAAYIPAVSNYGWEFPMLVDTIKLKQPEKFRLIMDYHSMDSMKYNEYLAPILNLYNKTSTSTYPIQPNTVKLYYFERKK